MVNIFVLLTIFMFQENDFKEIFGGHYNSSCEFLVSNESIIDSISSVYNTDPAVTSAIIFPELIRYSIIRDFIEVSSLELIYVNTGQIDFSIGPFQIKPSFAENIENKLDSIKELSKYNGYFQYSSSEEITIRRERLQRLKSFEWQLNYVSVFQKYIYLKYDFLSESDIEYQLRFISTAYNYNMDAGIESLNDNMSRAYFPWGSFNDKRKYNYSEISWYFFKDCIME